MRYLVSLLATIAWAAAQAEPVVLPAGMSVPLELQHHVNSAYTPTGSTIYFRVAQDVGVGGRTLIARGTLVKGRMTQTAERGMVGKSGSMTLEVDAVSAIDGTKVAVNADINKTGRSRAGATVAWTLFWGIPGLITRGVNPYLEKGTELLATTVTDASIDPDAATPPPAPPDRGAAVAIVEHRWEGARPNTEKTFDIERKTPFKTVAFRFQQPPESGTSIVSLQLVEVDGVAVPEESVARSFDTERGAAIFDGWSIARYCRDGSNTLLFLGRDASGRPIHATHQMRFKVKKKG